MASMRRARGSTKVGAEGTDVGQLVDDLLALEGGEPAQLHPEISPARIAERRSVHQAGAAGFDVATG